MLYRNQYAFQPIETRKKYSFPDYENPIEYDHICRYSKTRSIYDNLLREVYHESVSNYEVIESDNDKYVVVERSNMNRLDIISYQQYGNCRYWWVIALANNIVDAFDVPIGTILRIPPIANLYRKGSIFGLAGD